MEFEISIFTLSPSPDRILTHNSPPAELNGEPSESGEKGGIGCGKVGE